MREQLHYLFIDEEQSMLTIMYSFLISNMEHEWNVLFKKKHF